MKMNKFGIFAVFAIAFVGCKEKPKPVSADKPADVAVAEPGKEEPKTPEVKKPVEEKKEKLVLSPEERVAKLGFAKYLPAETEMAFSVFQIKESYEKMKGLKVISLIQEESAKREAEFGIKKEEMLEDGVELELEAEQAGEDDIAGDLPEDEMPEAPSAWTLLGQEVTVAFGKTSGEQMGHLLKLNERATYYQSAAFGKAVQALLMTGDLEAFTGAFLGNIQSESMTKLFEDSESGLALLDKAVFPPMYIAFRAKEGEGELEKAAQMVSGSMAFFGMAGEMAVPVEIETGGSKFAGYKLLGAKISEMMSENRESMEESMKPEIVNGLLATIAKKNIIVATGTIGDYVVVMIGGDEASMQLAADPKKSLGSSDKMSFVDEFGDKPFIMVSYGDQQALKTVMEKVGGLGAYAMGFREGITGSDEMRDLHELLKLFADREKALLGMGSTSTFGMVGYLDQGFKLDSFGGHDKGGVDWSTPTRLAHLGDSPDNLLFFNYPSNAAYNVEMKEYFALLGEISYSMAKKLSTLDIEDADMVEMKEYFKMFDKDFREDVLGLYQAASGDMMDGLGQESVFVIDMKGAMPAIPGIPQAVVNEAKAPRLSMIAPVKDRDKLKSGWAKMNSHTTSLLAKISEMAETKIPMQKPISSEKDGMVTWFISLPFMQDDFMPSVTLNDKLFVASTSKLQATDLIKKAEAGGETGQGISMRVNFKVLSDYADEMLKVAEKNADTLIKDEDARKDFMEEKSSILKMIEATREFDSMSWDVRKEEGVVRGRMHFKMN